MRAERVQEKRRGSKEACAGGPREGGKLAPTYIERPSLRLKKDLRTVQLPSEELRRVV